MKEEIKWIEPWQAIRDEGNYFADELARELPEGHILYGKKVTAAACRADNDDVLFKLEDQTNRFAVVHLTYSPSRESVVNFPQTTLYSDFETWVEECMNPAVIETAVHFYQQARTDGLCHEGALEVALAGVKDEGITAVIHQIIKEDGDMI